MQARTKALADDLIAACHRSSNRGDDLAREVLKALADQLGPDPTRPELCNPKGSNDLHAYNVPTGVILQINSIADDQREYSQFFPGRWVLPDGSWTWIPPAIVSERAPRADLDFLVDGAKSGLSNLLSEDDSYEAQIAIDEAASRLRARLS